VESNSSAISSKDPPNIIGGSVRQSSTLARPRPQGGKSI